MPTDVLNFWIAGRPIVSLARTLNFDHWIAGRPIIQFAPAVDPAEPIIDPPPIGLPAQGTPRRYATRDLDAGGVFFGRGLIGAPAVSGELVDTFFGQLAVQRVSLEVMLDATLLQGYQRDLRGQQFMLEHFDAGSGARHERMLGIVVTPELRAGRVKLDGQNFDPAIFEQDLPKGRITTALYPKAAEPALNEPITKVIGNVSQVPCRYINDDILNSQFDYLVCRGEVDVPTVWRVSPGDTLTTIAPGEYYVSTTLYPGFTTLTFLLRQTTTVAGSDYIPIFADVRSRTDTERNVARAIQAMLTNTGWGLGRTVDVASFDAAAALLDPTITGLWVDGALAAIDQAKNWLAHLFAFADIRLRITSAGAFSITIDTAQSMPRLIAQGHTGSGNRLLIDPVRTQASMMDAAKAITLDYREDLTTPGKFFFQQRRELQADLGSDRPYTNRFIRDHATADRVVDRMGKRLLYGEQRLTFRLPQEGRGILPGDLIQVFDASVGLAGDLYEVARLTHKTAEVEVEARGWNPLIYVYAPGTLPTDSEAGGGSGPTPQPPGFPPYDWGSPYYPKNQWATIDGRGTSPASPAYLMPATEKVWGYVVIPPGVALQPGSFKVWSNPIVVRSTPALVVDPAGILLWTIAQAASLRVTDDGAGHLIGNVGTGYLNTLNYTTGYFEFSWSIATYTPIAYLIMYA